MASPSTRNEFAGREATAAAASGNRLVKSFPLRVMSQYPIVTVALLADQSKCRPPCLLTNINAEAAVMMMVVVMMMMVTMPVRPRDNAVIAVMVVVMMMVMVVILRDLFPALRL
jgi:hypothetical protein